jgi:hypothetical protein
MIREQKKRFAVMQTPVILVETHTAIVRITADDGDDVSADISYL